MTTAALPDLPQLDVWFEFASTYSYPALMRLGPLADAAGVVVRYRPFLLGPIFRQQGLATSPFVINEAKGRYMWRDLERVCATLGLAFRRPPVFPAHSVKAARVALVALRRAPGREGWGEAFCRAVFHAEFGLGLPIDDPTVIADLLTALGVDAAPVIATTDEPEVKARLQEETAQAQSLGLFGSPSFVTADGEIFWGNDRLEQAIAWACLSHAASRSRGN